MNFLWKVKYHEKKLLVVQIYFVFPILSPKNLSSNSDLPDGFCHVEKAYNTTFDKNKSGSIQKSITTIFFIFNELSSIVIEHFTMHLGPPIPASTWKKD